MNCTEYLLFSGQYSMYYCQTSVKQLVSTDIKQDTVQSYDLENDTWELMKTKLPEPMTGVVACRVRLPQRLFEDYLSSVVT